MLALNSRISNCQNSRDILRVLVVLVATFFAPDKDVLYFIERFERNEFQVMFEELNQPIAMENTPKAIKQ